MGEQNFKWLKAAYSLAVTLVTVAFAAFAIDSGADPTLTGLFALGIIGSVNGFSAAEFIAVKRELNRRKRAEGFHPEEEGSK